MILHKELPPSVLRSRCRAAERYRVLMQLKIHTLLEELKQENPNEIWLERYGIWFSDQGRIISQKCQLQDYRIKKSRNCKISTRHHGVRNYTKTVAQLFHGYDEQRHIIRRKDAQTPSIPSNIELIDKNFDGNWGVIKGYSDYLVNKAGGIVNVRTNRMLSPVTEKHGYRRISIVNDNGKTYRLLVHRCVFMAFNQDVDISGLVINHLDSDPGNNRLDNLECCTQQDNLIHSVNYGLKAVKLGRIERPYIPDHKKQNRFSDWKF